MLSFHAVNKIRTSLKMKLSNYSWYQGSRIELENNKLIIKISSKYLNKYVRNSVPFKVDGVDIRLEQ